MTRFILSIDGGGIRGMLPAMVMAEVERRAQKPAAEIFDLMTGTSTGGIIAAALSMRDSKGKSKYSASQVVDFYKEMGPSIFKPPKNPLSFLYFSKYPNENVEKPLQTLFGDTTLKDTLSKIFFPTFDAKTYTANFFKSWYESHHHIKLRNVVKATSAAPTYFDPVLLSLPEERLLIDGAVIANNPAVCAYAEGRQLFPGEPLVMLSLGTGYVTDGPRVWRGVGRAAWVAPLVHVMFTSSRNTVSYQMKLFMGERYIRLSKALKTSSLGLDDASAEHMTKLQDEAREMIDDSDDKINNFITLLGSKNIS